jgi:hypothetical protein
MVYLLALLAADERTTFEFHATEGRLRWRRDGIFRHESGQVGFADITGLSLERDFRPGGRRGGAKRLVVHTTDGPIAVTAAYSGIGRSALTVGRTIHSYLKVSMPDRDIPFGDA